MASNEGTVKDMRSPVLAALLILACSTETESLGDPQRLAPYDPQLLAPYDERCESIRIPAFDKRAATRAPMGGFAPIPRQIHQIWLGPRAGRFDDTLASAVNKWRDYGLHLGYEHRLWTEADIAELKPSMRPQNAALVERFIATHAYHAASDILRLELLLIHGGVYVDCDFTPPTLDGAWVDFADFLPMRGTAFATEPNARNIGKSALFVMNGFVMASDNHPQIAHLVEHMERQVSTWETERHMIDAQYTTGPFYLNKALSGAFVVMPHTFLQDLGMVDAFWPR